MVHDITVHPVDPDLQVLGLVELVDLAQPRGDGVHLLLRLFQRDAVTQPCDDRQPGRVPREVGDVGGQHTPRIDVRRHRRVCRQIDPERRRQDAHHDRAPAIQLDRAADHIRIAAESPLPQPVAQHHRARRQVGIGVRELLGIDRNRVFLSKGPTVEWPDAQQLEQVPRRVAVRDALGLAAAGQRAGDGRRPGEALEPRGQGLVVLEIGSRYERALDIGRLQARPHERQFLGMIVRQRTKQNSVRHAEQGHVAADAERQGEDDHRREQRSSDEGANRVLEVANDVADHDYGCAFLQERGSFGTKLKPGIWLPLHAAAWNDLGERPAFDQFHREECARLRIFTARWNPTPARHVLGVSRTRPSPGPQALDGVDRDDVQMIQCGDRLRFALEALVTLGIVRDRARQHFDRDVAIEPRIADSIDLAHFACAQLREDGIRALESVRIILASWATATSPKFARRRARERRRAARAEGRSDFVGAETCASSQCHCGNVSIRADQCPRVREGRRTCRSTGGAGSSRALSETDVI